MSSFGFPDKNNFVYVVKNASSDLFIPDMGNRAGTMLIPFRVSSSVEHIICGGANRKAIINAISTEMPSNAKDMEAHIATNVSLTKR